MTSIEMDSYGLTAHTRLYPKDDNRDDAVTMCNAMLRFWSTDDPYIPGVRVLDGADQILASRHSGEWLCSWRR